MTFPSGMIVGGPTIFCFSPQTHHLFKKGISPLSSSYSWKKEKKNVLVKTIVKYIYPHYTRYSLSTQRQATDRHKYKDTRLSLLALTLINSRHPARRSTRVYGSMGWNFISSIVFFFAGEKWSENVVKVIRVEREKRNCVQCKQATTCCMASKSPRVSALCILFHASRLGIGEVKGHCGV